MREEYPQVLSASTLVGDKVTNPQGENLGEVRELVFDPDSGRVAYAVVALGGFLGLGEKLYAVPWEAFRLSTDEHKFYVDISKDLLKDAPILERERFRAPSDRAFMDDLYRHFGFTPYWGPGLYSGTAAAAGAGVYTSTTGEREPVPVDDEAMVEDARGMPDFQDVPEHPRAESNIDSGLAEEPRHPDARIGGPGQGAVGVGGASYHGMSSGRGPSGTDFERTTSDAAGIPMSRLSGSRRTEGDAGSAGLDSDVPSEQTGMRGGGVPSDADSDATASVAEFLDTTLDADLGGSSAEWNPQRDREPDFSDVPGGTAGYSNWGMPGGSAIDDASTGAAAGGTFGETDDADAAPDVARAGDRNREPDPRDSGPTRASGGLADQMIGIDPKHYDDTAVRGATGDERIDSGEQTRGAYAEHRLDDAASDSGRAERSGARDFGDVNDPEANVEGVRYGETVPESGMMSDEPPGEGDNRAFASGGDDSMRAAGGIDDSGLHTVSGVSGVGSDRYVGGSEGISAAEDLEVGSVDDLNTLGSSLGEEEPDMPADELRDYRTSHGTPRRGSARSNAEEEEERSQEADEAFDDTRDVGSTGTGRGHSQGESPGEHRRGSRGDRVDE